MLQYFSTISILIRPSNTYVTQYYSQLSFQYFGMICTFCISGLVIYDLTVLFPIMSAITWLSYLWTYQLRLDSIISCHVSYDWLF